MSRAALSLIAALAFSVPALAWQVHGVPITADPAANATTVNEMFYLSQIGLRSSHQIITGQWVGSVKCCGANGWTTQYPTVITGLYTATGQYPGLEGWTFNEYGSPFPQASDWTTLNAKIIAEWNAGSLQEITYSPQNPWTGGSVFDTTCNGGTLADLVNPATAVYATWHAMLANVAAQLQALQAAGVTVIWRPLPESNAAGFWYYGCGVLVNPAQFVAVWQDMFNLFTQTYGLHNLIWSFSLTASNYWWTRGDAIYPGSAYVDIVGQDQYLDATAPADVAYPYWSWWAAFGKPVVYNERGPTQTDISGASPVFTTLLGDMVNNGITTKPLGAFFMAWDANYSIVANPGASTLMNSPYAANRGDVKAIMDCMAAAASYAAKLACVMQ
jgi:hypothetical protein